MYDWLLGGIDNYPSDQKACASLLEIAPSTRELAVNNRRFLQRVVRTLAAEYKVRQFIDHGSGLPTQNNVHQIAQSVHKDARVVYIDNDPVVLAHGRAKLEENDLVAVLQADMTDTEGIFADQRVRDLIDLSKPTAALFVSVLHCIPDSAHPAEVVRATATRLGSGSYMVVCQLVSDRQDVRDGVTDLMEQATGGNWGRVREESDVHRFFEGMDVLDPGLVEVSQWRPDRDPRVRQHTDEWTEFGGLGRIR